MIRKPGGDWGRESAAVTAARTAAVTGKTAVRAGARAAGGVASCVFGAFWMLGALGSLFSGSIPGVVGCGAVGLFFIVRGGRAFAPRPETPVEAPALGAAAGSVDYARRKLAGSCLFGVVFIVLALAGLRLRGTYLQLVALVATPFFAFMVYGAVRKLFGDMTAVRWDGEGLTVSSLLGRRSATWSSVRSIGIEQVNTYAYGFFKVASRRSLAVRFVDGPWLTRRLAISADLLDLEGRTLEGLALTLQAAQLGRGARANAASPAAPAGVQSGGFARPRTPEARPFDADAAIARYFESQPAPAAPAPLPAPETRGGAAQPLSSDRAGAPGRRELHTAGAEATAARLVHSAPPRPVTQPAPAPVAPPSPPMSFGVYGARPARTTFGLRGT